MNNEKKELKKPFFANFLENQLSEEERKKVNGGDVTSKLDDNDTPISPVVPVTMPVRDLQHTLKYPSDGDDDTQHV